MGIRGRPPYNRGDGGDDAVNTGLWITFHFAAASIAFAWMWLRRILDGAQAPPRTCLLCTSSSGSSLCRSCRFGHLLSKIAGEPEQERNLRYEAAFWLASALAKIPLLTFFATGINARRNRVGVDNDIPDDDDSMEGIYTAAAATVVVVVVVAAILYFDKGGAAQLKTGYAYMPKARISEKM